MICKNCKGDRFFNGKCYACGEQIKCAHRKLTWHHSEFGDVRRCDRCDMIVVR